LIVIPILILPIFAQTPSVLVFSQIILRDSQGNLVTSFVVTKIGYIDEMALQDFLDDESSTNDPIMDIGGQKMQIIERAITFDFDSEDVLSDTTLNTFLDNGQIVTLVRLIHDGIPVTSGDEIIHIWTFIRPLK
jgi:hypothetical protein